VHAFIRSVIAKKFGREIADQTIIQYGGSVKPDNVKEIMSMPDIDGCLVGGTYTYIYYIIYDCIWLRSTRWDIYVCIYIYVYVNMYI
jgi:hypothetical protein